MTTDDVKYILENREAIEEQIAYHFRTYPKLLVQAFTRKSFAAEHDGYEDNEILEFYGDQLVNTVMTKWLYDSFSYLQEQNQDKVFRSKKTEAELSKIRANYVNRSALAHCIALLGLAKYLLLGNSDEKNEVWRNEKVRCDLFEALIGAVAVDSNWDFKQIEESCKAMWGMLDFEENYIDTVHDVCEDLNIAEPKFQIYSSIYGNKSFKCKITNWNSAIEGEGNSEAAARMDAARKALDALHRLQIEQIAEKASPDTAVRTLNTLYLKKFISKPELACSVSPDGEGNQIWRCECFIKEYEDRDGYKERGIGEGHTKAEAKQSAAYDMIRFMLGKENDNEEKPWICPSCGAENSAKDSICQICHDDDDTD